MINSGAYKDTKGNKVVDTSTLEAAFKMIGFQPESVAKIQQASGEVMQMIAVTKLMQAEMNLAMARAIFDKDEAAKRAAREAVAKWNDSNEPSMRVKINMPSVLQRVKKMGQSKEERIAATAPKAMRAEVKSRLKEATD